MKMQYNDSLDHHLAHPLEDSESRVESWVFNHRMLLLMFCLGVTLFFGYQATQLRLEASFEKMIPASHPYIDNYLEHKKDLAGLGNSIRIAVAPSEGDIFAASFQETLKKINDEVFFLPGVDRAGLKSLWTANTRWSEVTEEGFAGGSVIPDDYDGSPASLAQLRRNVMKAGIIGSLVANDFRSTIIRVPLYDKHPDTGEPLDYHRISQQLEELVREKYARDGVQIYITGFAKVVGDLIDGATQVVMFFAVALVITLVLLYLYSRCWRGSLMPLFCSLVAVIWQLGLLRTLGYALDPYSMLVPFLVFAIAVSHGVQLVNTISLGRHNGVDKIKAARRAFRALYIPGFIALLSDGLGFVTLMVIDIAVIRDLAVAASLGVAAIVLTNLVLLPVLLSFTGVNDARVSNTETTGQGMQQPWYFLTFFTRPVYATLAALLAVAAFTFGLVYSQDLKTGDLDAGAPELRADSRYNLDNRFMTSNYSTSTDLFVVMAQTEKDACLTYPVLSMVDRFQWHMENVAGVQSSFSVVNAAKRGMAGMNEGNLKWGALSRNQFSLNAASNGKHVPPGAFNGACNLLPIVIYLDDHKAETLSRVSAAAQQFIEQNQSEVVTFKLAAGNSGIEAATNEVIETAQYQMLVWVYGVVSLLCFLTFRSLAAVVCIVVPLALTSVLCQALMTWLGIGVKVATLPVIALGVGIGVDYGIYIYNRLNSYLKQGQPLTLAYYNTLRSTGKAVAFTGITLGIGVATWAWSPIKFQADLGILLTFMFVWNMLGALTLLPALVRLLVKQSPEDSAEEAVSHVASYATSHNRKDTNSATATSIQ